MIIRFWHIRCLLFVLMVAFFHPVAGQNEQGRIRCICIDAGHGGKDPGACGTRSFEKDIVLNIALKAGELVKQNFPGIKVVYTRDKDVFIDLDKRGKIANDNKADLFISVHCNSNDSKVPHGLETYVLGLHRSKENLQVAMKENSVIRYEKDYSVKYSGFDPSRPESYIIFSMLQNLYLEKSLDLAGAVQEEMVKETKRDDRGVRQAGYLVLKDAAMPAILIEAGFISNLNEESYLIQPATQQKIAAAIYRAVARYKHSAEGNSHLLVHKDEEDVREDSLADDVVTTPDASGLFYAIQVASATSRIENSKRLCSGEEVSELSSGGRFRYYVCESEDFRQVEKKLSVVRSKVRDCFIIAVYKGKMISMAEAKKIERR